MKSLLASIAAVASLVGLASCSEKGEADPEIRIVSPLADAVIDSTSILVRVEVEGFTLSPDIYPPPEDPFGDTPAKPFRGHWHLYVRGPGEDAFQFIDDQIDTEAWLSDLGAGIHEIVAELVNENHVPVYSTPLAYIAVRIADDPKSIRILSPDGSGFFHDSSSVDALVEIENFTIGTDGHWHLVFGTSHLGTVVGEGLALDAVGTDLAPGNTRLWAVLANDDHSPLDPPVVDDVALTVPSTAPRISLLEPANGATVGSTIDARVAVSNFTLVDPSTAVADTAGQGHWHLLVNGIDQDLHAFSTSALGIAVSSSASEIRVELRSSVSHGSQTPRVVDLSRVD